MPKDDLVYVGHMLDTARKAVRRVQGKARADFDADGLLSPIYRAGSVVVG